MNQDKTWAIEMKLDGNSSRYLLGPLAGLELGRFVPAPPPVYLVDQVIADLHPAWLRNVQTGCHPDVPSVLTLPGGEEIKTLARLEEIYTWLAERRVPRDGTLVVVGGGSLLDLGGMAAGTWRRGMNFVAIPTTLLAMVDAALGGKAAVNLGGVKNPVGVFHPATAILADCCFLATLPRQAWRDGLAEMIKAAIIGDPRLFAHLHHSRGRLKELFATGDAAEPVAGILNELPVADWIAQAAAVKADVVTRDFHEQGPRRALNLGHTVGHALEAWSRGSDSPLSHGQAVAIGMAAVFRVAAERGTCPLDTAVQVIELIEACGLPATFPCPPTNILAELLAGDKKQSGTEGLRWVLPVRLGQMDIEGRVTVTEIMKWLD